MYIFLLITAGYLCYTFIVFAKNGLEFTSLSKLPSFSLRNGTAPLVSICIPARNEEQTIDRCLTSVLKQDYPNFEILVLNDGSADRTANILDEFSGIIANFHHLTGEPKPSGWLGKPWACHQLGKHAKGDYLFFMDADTWLDDTAVSKAVQALHQSDAITVWPKQHLHTFWEKVVIPHIYFGLYTLLPAAYVRQTPNWIPKSFRKSMGSKFAAACGQFIAFSRPAYQEIDGHASVKNKVVEDVELAKVLKSHQLTLTMYDGVKSVHCRMYETHAQIFAGFRKNFFAGFNYNFLPFTAMAVLQFIVYILPFFFLIFGDPLAQTLSFLLIGIFMIQRWLLDLKFGWDLRYSFLHPLGIIWFEALGIRCILDYLTGTKTQWKGRDV